VIFAHAFDILLAADMKHRNISVVIPVRNERTHIRSSLASMLSQTYPAENTEIVVADGMSDDSTREICDELALQHENIRIIDNPEQIVSSGLNRAIRQTSGDIVVRMDVHSVYPPDYLSSLVGALSELDADNVGGVVETLPSDDSLKSRSIALSLSNCFGVGNSRFRTGAANIREVDTVPFGCFRREVFDTIGYFDEELIRNQDDEFNARMKKHGMKICLVPHVKIKYYARDTFLKLFRMFYQYGYFKPLVNKKIGGPATARQLIPPCFVLFLLSGVLALVIPAYRTVYAGGLCCYGFINAVVSLHVSKKKPLLGLLTMHAHFVQHVAYGLGYLKGIVDFVIFRKRTNDNISISR